MRLDGHPDKVDDRIDDLMLAAGVYPLLFPATRVEHDGAIRQLGTQPFGIQARDSRVSDHDPATTAQTRSPAASTRISARRTAALARCALTFASP